MISPLVYIKLFLKKFFNLRSFCKQCGRCVTDFDVSDDIWNKVDRPILYDWRGKPLKWSLKFGHTLCYNCFTMWAREHLGRTVPWNLK
jgi:hypothetical protein